MNTLQERINLVENPGFLYYANGGSFIPGTVQKALATHGPQRHYCNECLCNVMVNFNMIDIVGRGIRKIFNQQSKIIAEKREREIYGIYVLKNKIIVSVNNVG